MNGLVSGRVLWVEGGCFVGRETGAGVCMCAYLGGGGLRRKQAAAAGRGTCLEGVQLIEACEVTERGGERPGERIIRDAQQQKQ